MKPTEHDTVFLLVEDDRNDAFFVEREFKNTPYNIVLKIVHDGHEAMQYISGDCPFGDHSECPTPNVILLDLKMPRVNGFEFLKWLRHKAPARFRMIPVIIMSSSNLPEDVSRAYDLGANSYLVKPVEWRKFKALITELGIYWTHHALTPQF